MSRILLLVFVSLFLHVQPALAISGPSAGSSQQVETIPSTSSAAPLSQRTVRKEARTLRREQRLQARTERQSLKQARKRSRGDKSFIAAIILSVLFGVLAIDRFYLGRWGTGILKLITFAGFGIWYWVDIVLIATESMQPKNGEYYDN